MDRVRVGVIGTSYWADDFHLPTLKSHDAAVLAAICGRNEKRAHELADKFGVEQVFTNYEEMLDRASLDAVCVVTPEDLHNPMVMAAVSAGLHVLCEKPMAFSASQSAQMLAAAEKAGVRHMVQFTNRGLPHYRFIKAAHRRGVPWRALLCVFLLAQRVGSGTGHQSILLAVRRSPRQGSSERARSTHHRPGPLVSW